jgi:hypothetical protein
VITASQLYDTLLEVMDQVQRLDQKVSRLLPADAEVGRTEEAA